MIKDAIIFILDANISMDTPYPPSTRDANDGGCSNDSWITTRLDQAKDAALETIIDRMWKAKTNEAGVIILKAGMTHHHLSGHERIINDDADISKFFVRCAGGVEKALKKYNHHSSSVNGDDCNTNDIFPNLVEFELKTPCSQTLRSIRNIQCTINETMISSTRGDLCDGLILAADALHRRTNGKKYKRTIVLITDAEHEVHVNGEQLQCVLDGLIRMEVELIVLGIGFEEASSVLIKNENFDDSDNIDKKPEAITPVVPIKQEEGNPDGILEVGDTNQDFDIIKRENEKLLHSITKATGGCILAATGGNLTELLQSKLPSTCQTTQSIGKKILFRIAPNLSLVVKSSKLTAEQHLPTTVKEAYQFDPATGEKLRDGNGELMTLPTRTQTDHYDDDGNLVPLGECS
jgi:hypothetical protein